jgi:hypothetical protein
MNSEYLSILNYSYNKYIGVIRKSNEHVYLFLVQDHLKNT